VRQEVDIDTYPVCVAIIDGDTKVVVEKGVEAVSLWVDPKPRERVVAKKGAPWEDGRVEVRGEAEEGVCVGRRWREAGKEGAQSLNESFENNVFRCKRCSTSSVISM
jgi:hypothetical protein